ncbi:MAG: hypothetical protein U9Q88_02705 [Bacillota bacterium]|nr:hypothetical protein [Bacillota bacterium]
MEEQFKLTGKSVRIARLIKGVKIKAFSENVGLSLNHCSRIEREELNLSFRNHFRMLRELRNLGYTDQQLVAIMILAENIEEVEDSE